MRGYTFTQKVTLIHHVCGNCGVSFGLEESYEARRRDDAKTWYCPNGCPRAWCDSEADRLKAQLAKETARLDQMRAERDRHATDAAAKAAELARHQKRTRNGVCPCCKRSFTNLRRHMATKHPEHGPASKASVAESKERSAAK